MAPMSSSASSLPFSISKSDSDSHHCWNIFLLHCCCWHFVSVVFSEGSKSLCFRGFLASDILIVCGEGAISGKGGRQLCIVGGVMFFSGRGMKGIGVSTVII
eukprot:14845870-Ditylum_brightwellii.AAC.1